MKLTHYNIFYEGRFVTGSLEAEGGLITRIDIENEEETGSLPYLLPGLVEAHSHGNSGADFSDGDYEGLKKMGRFYAANGVTSFAPTSMTLPYEVLAAAFSTAKEYRQEAVAGGAYLAGIHMEGPFFSEKKKGAQNGAYLRLPDFDAFEKLQKDCGGLVRIVDVAPELDGAAAFTEKAKKLCRVSVAHTDANYEQAKAVFEAGASHLTHLFNAMPGIHHRNPGVIGAASENKHIRAELICDGLHVHESAVRMAFKLFPGRICLISDSLRCAGMPEGEYELGGQAIYLKNRSARLADGTLAGSVITLLDGLKNAVRFGIDREEAILSSTLRPAEELNIADKAGSLAPGKRADMFLCDDAFTLREVFLAGDPIG